MHMTKMSRKATGCWITLFGLFAITLLLAGCAGSITTDDSTGAPVGTNSNDSFVVGDEVTIKFSGIESPPTDHSERIKEDGTITMPLIFAVHAAGKTPGELQKEIHDRYLPFYRGLTVTVQDPPRFYTVGGEVNGKGPKEWSVGMDIIKAIQASGDFTDFAKKTKVRLIRNGHTQTINYVKAVQDPENYHVLIYPGDKIIVPRRMW